MDTLARLCLLLAALRAAELQWLFTACDAANGSVPGLITWLQHAVGWEQDRRAGFTYPLRGPMAAIPDEELARSIVAVGVLATMFRVSREHDGKPIAALFDLLGVILRAEAERPATMH